jgi:signal transduction histidine kinase
VSLLANAEQAMKATGGILTVRLSDVRMEPSSDGCLAQLTAGEYVCLTTTYNNQGTMASEQTAAFAPLDAPDGEGRSGVGLAVVEGVVRSHGGAMHVSTETANGTSVEIFWPALNPDDIADTAPGGVTRCDQGNRVPSKHEDSLARTEKER